MNFDKIFQVYRKEKISDEMGGWEVKEAMIGNIKGFTSPVEAEIMLKEYGIASTTALKIFTKYNLPKEHFFLRYWEENKIDYTDFEILQFSDYEKYRMMLVQVI